MKQIKSYDDNFFLDAIKPSEAPCFAEARELAYEFSSSAFENIRDFPFVYFTDGATGAINSIIPKFEQVRTRRDDYRYVRCFGNVNTQQSPVQYFSYPFSGSGEFEPIPVEPKIILDCSYMFASNMSGEKIVPNNVDFAIFSLSKSHNLSTLRCGWFFSKTMVPEFHILQYQFDYGSSMHVAALREVSRYKPNELYLHHQKSFTEKYSKVGATEGATNLFGVLSGDRIPYYMIS